MTAGQTLVDHWLAMPIGLMIFIPFALVFIAFVCGAALYYMICREID